MGSSTAKYKSSTYNSDKNKVESSGTSSPNAANIARNNSAERSSDWSTYIPSGATNYTLTYDSSTSYIGSKSLKISQNSTSPKRVGFYENISVATVTQSKTATFSAYVKTNNVAEDTNKGALLYVEFYGANGYIGGCDGSGIFGTNNWTRIKKSLSSGDETFTRDDSGNLLAEKRKDGSYIYYLYDTDGTVKGFTHNNSSYFYTKNLQGDVTAILDSNMNVMVLYKYDAYGNLLSMTDSNGNSVLSDANNIGNINRIRYRSYYYDTDVDMYYLSSRFYVAEIGRFLNVDAFLATAQGIIGHNMFIYSLNNPINMIDFSGNRSIPVWERFGFYYDGSMGDFRNLEAGRPPRAYLEWLKNQSAKQVNSTPPKKSSRPQAVIKTLTYISKDETSNYYREKYVNREMDVLLSASISAMLNKIVSSLAKATFGCKPKLTSFIMSFIEVGSALSEANDCTRFENAMDQGSGVLIVEWEYIAERAVPVCMNKYYSWDGKSDIDLN